MLNPEPTPTEGFEAQLMVRAASGDDRAFETLVDRHQAGLVQFFTLLTHNRADGEDLAQEAFVRLYRNRHGYQPKAQFRTFLYTIARNLWTDFLRRKYRRREHPLENPDLLSSGLEPCRREISAAMDRHRKALFHALSRLPVEQRIVLLLSQIEEMSYPEIAQTLAIPVGTVKSRVHHAVRKLQTLLKRS